MSRMRRLEFATHVDMDCREAIIGNVSGVARDARRPDSAVAEGERQREDAGDDKDDDDDVMYSSDATQFLRSGSMTHEDVSLHC